MLGLTTDYFNIILNILTSNNNYKLSDNEQSIILNEDAYNETILAIIMKFITIQNIEEHDSPQTKEIINKYFNSSFKWNDEYRKLKSIRNYVSHDKIECNADNYIFNGKNISGLINKKEFFDFVFSTFKQDKELYLNMILLVTRVKKLVTEHKNIISKYNLCNGNNSFGKFLADPKTVEQINLTKYTNVFVETRKYIKQNELVADDVDIDNIYYYVDYSPEYLEKEKIILAEYIEKQRVAISEYAYNMYKLRTAKDKRISTGYYEKMNKNLLKKAELESHQINAEKYKQMAIEKLEYLNLYNEILPSNWEFLRRLRNGFVHNTIVINGNSYCINDRSNLISFVCYLTEENLEDLTDNIIFTLDNSKNVRVRD